MSDHKYRIFYLIGRNEQQDHEVEEYELDYAASAKKALDDLSIDPYVLAKGLAQDTLRREQNRERAWSKENAAEIKNAGGSATIAFTQYMRGRVDELAVDIEADILTAIGDSIGDVENGDADDDEDDDDEEDDEDEDGEEDDEGDA